MLHICLHPEDQTKAGPPARLLKPQISDWTSQGISGPKSRGIPSVAISITTQLLPRLLSLSVSKSAVANPKLGEKNVETCGKKLSQFSATTPPIGKWPQLRPRQNGHSVLAQPEASPPAITLPKASRVSRSMELRCQVVNDQTHEECGIRKWGCLKRGFLNFQNGETLFSF